MATQNSPALENTPIHGPQPPPRDQSRTATENEHSLISLTPKQYAEAVYAHSKQGIHMSLYPGHNFEKLAAFLLHPYQPSRRLGTSPPLGADNLFPFVTQYLFSSHDKEIKTFAAPTELEERQKTLVPSDMPSSQILFLRGQPSGEWLSAIGACYGVDPEYFQRHLRFYSTAGRPNYYSLPSLPSVTSHLITLRFTTIGQREGQTLPSNQDELESRRQNCAKLLGQYFQKLSLNLDNNFGLGNSIVREFSIHDETHFIMDQEISLCVVWNGKNWAVLAWLDTGKDLSIGPEGPWINAWDRKSSANRTSFYPTIQIQPWTALSSSKMTLKDASARSTRYVQSSSLLHLDYGKTLNPLLLETDPFYAVHELFLFAAFSQVQFLSFIESGLFNDSSSDTTSKGERSISSILYKQKVLETHADTLRENIESIKVRGGPTWASSTDSTAHQIGLAASQSLLKDYEHLLDRMVRLSKRCEARINFIMNEVMIDESNKAITQAQEVTKLTRLAFLYIPLNFTTSFFGMNLSPLVEANHSLWLYFVVTLPTLLLSLCFMRWSFSDIWKLVN